MSTMASSSPALISRVTPRSTTNWKSSWKSPKPPHPGPTKRSPKASANFDNVPSTRPYRSPRNKRAYNPNANTKALIDRLSPSTHTRTEGARRTPDSPPLPTDLFNTLMQSETLPVILSSGKDMPINTSGDMNHDLVKQPSTSAADSMNTTEEGPNSLEEAAHEDQQPTSPMSSTSAADVDEILRAAADSDQVDSGMPTTTPNSPIDGQAAAAIATAAPTSLYERCRRLILPLVIQNARARDTKVDSAGESERVEQQVMTLMTDERCADFMNMAKEVKEQMATLKKGAVGNGESIVRVKRPREEDSTEGSITSRVRLNSDGFGSSPRAPKAMVQTKQNEALDKFTSIVPHTDNNIHVSPTRTPPSLSQPRIQIPMEPKHFGPSPNSDRRESDYDVDADRPGRRQDKDRNRDIEYRRDRSYDLDKSTHQSRSRGGKSDHRRRDSQHCDRDMDRYDSGRRGSGDGGSRQIDRGRKGSRYADSDFDKLDRRRHDRSDKEWDYVRDRRDSSSGSRKYSSSGSSHRHSQELLESRISGPGVTPAKTVTCEPSSTGPSCRVPGLWFVKVGLNHMDVVNMIFEVDAEVASRCRRENGSNIAVRLVCLPTVSVEETYKQLDPAASPKVVTDAMRSVKPEWPPKGKIIIEVNPGDKLGRSWLPRDLDPAVSVLELTPHIQLGQNNIRLIHLGDLSSHTFLLHAAELRPSSLPTETPSPKPKDLVDSDCENYMARLQATATKQSDVRGGPFKFVATVAVEAQTV